jgi:hypothetical protein
LSCCFTLSLVDKSRAFPRRTRGDLLFNKEQQLALVDPVSRQVLAAWQEALRRAPGLSLALL